MKRTIAIHFLLSAFFLLKSSVLLNAQVTTFRDVDFPSNSGIINMKTAYGLVGDGVTDESDKIIAAIRANVGTHQTLFFPAGTYLVSKQMDWKNAEGKWRCYLTFQGAGANRTIIKLADNSPDFCDYRNPRPLIRPGSKSDDPMCSSYNKDAGDGGGNCGFENYIFDLTINTGYGNAGVIALDFVASNWGGVENVKIISGDKKGLVGLSLHREVGPAIIKNVLVDGFDCGIKVDRDLYGITFENISLANQNEMGVSNNDNTIWIRNLESNNKVPAVSVEGISNTLIINGKFKGGSSSTSAIRSVPSYTPVLFLRDVATLGYTSALNYNGEIVPGNSITEYVSHPVQSLFPTLQKSLNLEIKETPVYDDNNLSNWVSVADFPGDDATAIQSAIDAGKPIVYFPLRTYTINKTVHIRGNVKKVIGFNSTLIGTAEPLLVIDNNPNVDVVIIERFNTGSVTFHSMASQKVVFKGMAIHKFTSTGSGELYFEDYVSSPMRFTNQNVWARQLDQEGEAPKCSNSGGNLWILGMKTEGGGTIFNLTNGGKTELLGGMFYVGGGKDPAIINSNSSISATFTEVCFWWGSPFASFVKETRGSVTKTLDKKDFVKRLYGGYMPLYVGYEIPAKTK